MKKEIIKKGDRFNRLVAIKFVEMRGKPNQQCWSFRCDCGTDKVIKVNSVKNGNTSSCGCLFMERITKMGKKSKTHGMKGTRIYSIWNGMKQRCTNKKVKEYKDYGGRGIKVCERWLKFENFYEDMGDIPKGKTLDRIDNNGNYCKKNCRFVSMKIQCNNRRNNHFLTCRGKTLTISQWSTERNIKQGTLSYRIHRGWSIPKALNFNLPR